MMKAELSCSVILTVIAIALVIWGFVDVFRKANFETDFQVLQRQLRGFALLILASMFMAASSNCNLMRFFGGR